MKIKAILRRSLQLINAVEIGADPTADEYSDALDFLNDWLAGQDGLFSGFYSSREEFSTVAGQRIYTIGSGGDFNTARPISIDSAQIKETSGNTEWDVEVVAQNMYDNHALKLTQGKPYKLYYDPEYSLGKIYLYFVPEQIYTLRLNMKKQLSEYTSINNDFALPDPYRRAVVFNLAVEISDAWGFSAPAQVKRIADKTMKIVRRINLNNNMEDANLDTFLQTISNGGGGREFFNAG